MTAPSPAEAEGEACIRETRERLVDRARRLPKGTVSRIAHRRTLHHLNERLEEGGRETTLTWRDADWIWDESMREAAPVQGQCIRRAGANRHSTTSFVTCTTA